MAKEERAHLRIHPLVILYGGLLLLTLALVLRFGQSAGEEPKTIGFITSGDVSTSGWNSITYQGAKEACEALGVKFLARDKVAEFSGACPKAVQDMVNQGAGMIILNSYGYAQEMRGLFSEYPTISFYGSAADFEAPNLSSYASRMYQARYLSGIVAGAQTRTNRIGFVAAVEEPDVRRGINAFTLGVRRVNPKAEVVVAWSGGWDNEQREKDLTRALIDNENVDVVTYHQDHPYVIEAAEEAGVQSIGYYEEVEDVSERYLTCVICDWAPLYEDLIHKYLQGKTASSSNWLGLKAGVVLLTDFSPLVSQETRDEVERAAEEIRSGLDVFTNVIYDNQGNLRCGEGEAISDETLLRRIDWLAEGVRVYDE